MMRRKPEFRNLGSGFSARSLDCCRSFIGVLALLVVGARGQELAVQAPAGSVKIVQHGRADDYYLLTPDQEIVFRAEGPGWLRIYTRQRCLKSVDTCRYELIVTGPTGEQRQVLEATRSNAARDEAGNVYTRWRSFYQRLLPGRLQYRIALSRPSNPVAVRFVPESPKPWMDVLPESGCSRVRLVVQGSESDWCLVQSRARNQAGNSSVQLKVDGPARLLIEVRAACARSARGRRDFAVEVTEDGVVFGRQEMSALKLLKARIVGSNSPGAGPGVQQLIPTAVQKMRIDVPVGRHILAVNFMSQSDEHGLLRFRVRQ